MRYSIHLGDVVTWCNAYEGEPFHAVVTDPPYELGFMGKGWDRSGVAFRSETWAAIGRCLHPGAFLVAFAAARGVHRMAVAIEDAGFIIHPFIFGYSYGSGFPKATRIDTQIDRAAGAQRRVVGRLKRAGKDRSVYGKYRGNHEETAPATDLAAAWAGHRYGLQALKPALEPIIVAQWPYRGKAVPSIVETGAGALWIDGGRIGTTEDMNPRDFDDSRRTSPKFSGMYNNGREGQYHERNGTVPPGRWPANFYLQHHPACTDTCHPDCPVERIGQQSGDGGGGKFRQSGHRAARHNPVYGTPNTTRHAPDTYGDTGTAARYFFNADWMLDRLEDADPVLYAAKASKAEREAGLLPAQRAHMAELYDDQDIEEFESQTVDDGRQTPIDNPYLRGQTERYNTHPTIKPLAVAKWLATLLLPPDLYAPRRLLVPFSGAGSEMIGALLAGWEEVQGVELMPEHVEIARARLDWWCNKPDLEREQIRTAMTRPIKAEPRSVGGFKLTPLEEMIAEMAAQQYPENQEAAAAELRAIIGGIASDLREPDP